MSPRAKSAKTKGRVATLTIAIFALVAVVNWWMIIEEGANAPRVIAAVAGTVGVIVQAVARKRHAGGEGT